MFGYYLDLALRSLKRNKMLTALMIVAIAVGIGASMTTLTVMHLLSGDPLPGRSQHIFYPQVDPGPNPGKDHQAVGHDGLSLGNGSVERASCRPAGDGHQQRRATDGAGCEPARR